MHSSKTAVSNVWIRFRWRSYGVLPGDVAPAVDAVETVASRFASPVQSASSRCCCAAETPGSCHRTTAEHDTAAIAIRTTVLRRLVLRAARP
jgi:hypothetical protein